MTQTISTSGKNSLKNQTKNNRTC